MQWFFGQVPKWPKGADCKSAGTAFSGSNPFLPTYSCECWVTVRILARGERLSTLLMIAGIARVAQAVEHTLGKGVVKGSSPFAGSRMSRIQTWQ